MVLTNRVNGCRQGDVLRKLIVNGLPVVPMDGLAGAYLSVFVFVFLALKSWVNCLLVLVAVGENLYLLLYWWLYLVRFQASYPLKWLAIGIDAAYFVDKMCITCDRFVDNCWVTF